jgi:hypothetical protein
VIGMVGVHPSGDRKPRHSKSLTAGGHLDGLKVPSADRSSYEGVDLREDLGCETASVGSSPLLACPPVRFNLLAELLSRLHLLVNLPHLV